MEETQNTAEKNNDSDDVNSSSKSKKKDASDTLDTIAADDDDIDAADTPDTEDNLLEESGYVPVDDELDLLEPSKRKTNSDEDDDDDIGHTKMYKKSKHNRYYEDERDAVEFEEVEDEDDDDFDEDDDDEFEIERQQNAVGFGAVGSAGVVDEDDVEDVEEPIDPFANLNKDYESDVDSLTGGDLSNVDDDDDDDDELDGVPKTRIRKSGMIHKDLDINEILEQGINLDKTVQLSDIVENADELLTKDLSSIDKDHDADIDDDDDDDVEDEEEFDEIKDDEDVDMDFEISEKLKDMGEISVKPVSKSDKKKEFNLGDEISVEITKKGSNGGGGGGGSSTGGGSDDTEDKRKISNLRKNIREVMDDNQLDASTLAAQRQELERLARVQEQQRIIREVQRQIAMERQNSKTQNRVLSLLQGHTSLLKGSSGAASGLAAAAASASTSSKISLPGNSSTTLMKISAADARRDASSYGDPLKLSGKASLTPSVSIAPVKPPALRKDLQTDHTETTDDEDDYHAKFKHVGDMEDDDDDDRVKGDEHEDDDHDGEQAATLTTTKPKKDVVTIVDSSDDDCIVLSDDDEVPEEEDDPQNSGLHVNDTYNVPDEQGRVVINIGHPEGEEDIFLAPQIARIIKPHQIGGVRFLFDNIIESVERFSTSTGFGCILAHSMGLGKTLQLVCFCDIFLRHTTSKTVLCIMPINTLQNWMAEFNMWLPEDSEKSPLKVHSDVRPRNFKLFVLNDTHKTLSARSKVILDWARDGGVLLMGYELYRLLSLKKVTKKRGRKVYRDPEVEKEELEVHKKLLDEMHAALVKPGPDLIVCDEGHRIKNSHASISVALKQIRSKRRIVLTGYPLQNNLLEYWCMVDFVRPNYLGTKTEFSNMFERPIQNGQCIDSTPQDIKLMRYRAHVLHSLLLGFVQRRSHVVLQNSLPQKQEYVLLVRMTSFQRDLYEVFMNDVVRTKAVPNPLKAFAVCCKIWNHPDVLYNFLKKREADLDLEEAEAAAADPTYEPYSVASNDSSATTTTSSTTIATPTTIPMATGKSGGKNVTTAQTKEKKPRKPRTSKKAKPAASIPPSTIGDSESSSLSASTPAPPPPPPPTKSGESSNDTSETNDATKVDKEQTKLSDTTLSTEIKKEDEKDLNPFSISNISSGNGCMTNEIKKESTNGTPSYQQNQQQQQDNNSYNTNQYNYNSGGGYYNNYDPNNYYGGGYNTGYNQHPPPPPPGNYYSNQNYGNQYHHDMYGGNQYPPQHGQNNYNWQHPQSSYYGNQNQYNSNPNYPNYDYNNGNNYQSQQQQSYQQPPPQQQPNSGPQSYPSQTSDWQQSNQQTTNNDTINTNDTNTETNTSSDVKPIKTEEDNKDDVAAQIVDMDTKEIKTEITPTTAAVDDSVKSENVDEKPVKSETNFAENPDIKDEAAAAAASDKNPDVKIPRDDLIPYDWAVELMKNYVPDLIENSPKMEIFFCILEESLKLGDRMLVFSQSLLTLNLIERFLQMNNVNGTEAKWAKNTNYYRLDGSTAALEREKLINEFNSNPNIHLFLVSTRAGSLGINLVGANRVVVFDASWNPCHDTQAVCRVYRYGQKKPCFVYRIVMDSCLEKKIYDRQVNKQGMSDRVVDECNPDARLSLKEVTNLCWDDEPESEVKDFSDCKDKYLDIVAQKIIEKHSKSMTKEPFQHESLLIDRKEKKLSMAEKRLAQRGYELEKQAASKPSYIAGSIHGTNYRTMRTPDGNIVHRPVASVRPMQADLAGDRMRTGAARPTRWIPAEVWQRQGMTAQVLTLPGDVVIPTSSAEKSNIVLKEGQKVMVLKSPKGIYMQLESGKIIAIRTAFKMGHGKDKSPSGLIGREFPSKRSPVADLPSNLKNNQNITIIPNKQGRPIGSYIRPSNPVYNTLTGAPPSPNSIRPTGGATTTSSTSSLQSNKPRPPTAANMSSNIIPGTNNKPRMPIGPASAANSNTTTTTTTTTIPGTNKNIQLGTARPYNHKQQPQGPRFPITGASKSANTMRPSPFSSSPEEALDIDSGSNDDVGNNSNSTTSSSTTKLFEGKLNVDNKTDIIEGTTKKTLSSDSKTKPKVEVISQEVIRKADDDKSDLMMPINNSSNDDVIMVSSDDKTMLPKSQNDRYNSYYGGGGGGGGNMSSGTSSNYYNQPQSNYLPHQQRGQSYPYYNQQQSYYQQQSPQYSATGQQQLPMPHHQHNQQYSQHYSSSTNYDYPMGGQQQSPYSGSSSQTLKSTMPTGMQSHNQPTTITIDDDIDQPLREKVVYKPNLVERKPKAGPGRKSHDYHEPSSPQYNYHHSQQQQQHSHNSQYNQQESMPPRNTLKNYRHKQPSKLSPNDSLDMDGSNSYDSENTLSYLERTTSAIDENQSDFTASLSDITRPPSTVSGSSSSSMQIPAALESPTPTKPKPKPRSKAAAAAAALRQQQKSAAAPTEPKPIKEKPKPASKKNKMPIITNVTGQYSGATDQSIEQQQQLSATPGQQQSPAPYQQYPSQQQAQAPPGPASQKPQPLASPQKMPPQSQTHQPMASGGNSQQQQPPPQIPPPASHYGQHYSGYPPHPSGGSDPTVGGYPPNPAYHQPYNMGYYPPAPGPSNVVPPSTFQPPYDPNYGNNSAFHKPDEMQPYGNSTAQDSQANAYNNQSGTPLPQQSPTAAYPAQPASQPQQQHQQQPPPQTPPQQAQQAPVSNPNAATGGYQMHQQTMPPPQIPSYQSYYPPQPPPVASNYPPPHGAYHHNYPPNVPYNQPYAQPPHGQDSQYGGYAPPPPPPPHGNYNYPPYNPHPGQWQ